MHFPTNRQDLWLFIFQHFGLQLPWKKFTVGHSTPFDFVADAWFNPAQDLAAWANRSGIKTLGASVIAALEFARWDHLRARVLAGSEDQAKQLYEYWADWCCRTLLRDRLDGEPGKLSTRIAGGNMEILAASQKRVRGPKIQRLFRDERDEIEPGIIGASLGMLASLKDIPSRTIDTSTWHRPHGPMGELVAQANEKGIRLHKWNIWESLEECTEERHQKGKGCESCKLSAFCLAKARERNPQARIGIAKDCCGLLSIDDAIKQASQWSLEQFQAEAECKRPVLHGMVYPQFDRAVHVKDDLDFNDNLPTFRAIDWGINGFVCQWIQEGKTGEVYVVDEFVTTDATVHTNAQEITKRDAEISIQGTYCDPAGQQRNDQTGLTNIQVFKSYQIPCTYRQDAWATAVQNGVQLLRGALKPALGPPKLWIAGACKETIKAFESYRLAKRNDQYIDQPADPQPAEHPMDALRYYFVNRKAPPRASAKYMGYA